MSSQSISIKFFHSGESVGRTTGVGEAQKNAGGNYGAADW